MLFVEDTTRAREQAQQLKLAALGRLTANIAHEIRNPLAAISHAAELLGEEKRGAGPRAPDAHHPRQRAAPRPHGDGRAAAQPARPRPAEPIRLQPWLGRLRRRVRANEAVPAERFVLETRARVVVEFDREHLHQVMWNLVRNAVRHARAEPRAACASRSAAGRPA